MFSQFLTLSEFSSKTHQHTVGDFFHKIGRCSQTGPLGLVEVDDYQSVEICAGSGRQGASQQQSGDKMP
ncbi:hypothetical protein TW84_06740 [Vibrio neptunius]|nr:hypothetical protein TW84_06740 [Vibrio neptunius]